MSTEKEMFSVDAGKFEFDGDKNYKYCDSFDTLSEAIQACRDCFGYHFIDLTFHSADGAQYEISFKEM